MATFKVGFVRVGHHEHIHHLDRMFSCDEPERFPEELMELRERTQQSTGYQLFVRTIERVAEPAEDRQDQAAANASQ